MAGSDFCPCGGGGGRVSFEDVCVFFCETKMLKMSLFCGGGGEEYSFEERERCSFDRVVNRCVVIIL